MKNKLSLLENFYLNCTIKGRKHFIFATSSYSNPNAAISRYTNTIKEIESKYGAIKTNVPRNRIDSGESLEYLLNSRVDKYLGIDFTGRKKWK